MKLNVYDLFEDEALSREEPGLTERVEKRTLARLQSRQPKGLRTVVRILAAAAAITLLGGAAFAINRHINTRRLEQPETVKIGGEEMELKEELMIRVEPTGTNPGNVIGFRAEALPELSDGWYKETAAPLSETVQFHQVRKQILDRDYGGRSEGELTLEENLALEQKVQEALLAETPPDVPEWAGAFTELTRASSTAGFSICVLSDYRDGSDYAVQGSILSQTSGEWNGMEAVYLTVREREPGPEEDPLPSEGEPFYTRNVLLLYNEEYGCVLSLTGNAGAFDFAALERLASQITLVPTDVPMTDTRTDSYRGMIGFLGMG